MDDTELPGARAARSENSPADCPPAEATVSRRAAVGGLAAMSLAAGSLLPAVAAAQTKGPSRAELKLKDSELAEKVNKLFDEMRKDKAIQKQFIENPNSLIAARFLPAKSRKVSAQRVSNANRALYSILSNEGFYAWVQSYQSQLAKKPAASKSQVLADVADAMAKHADEGLLQAILEEDPERSGDEPPDIIVVHSFGTFFVNVLLINFVITDLLGAASAGTTVTARDLRAIAEQMSTHAGTLRKAGKLNAQIITLK